MPQPDSADSERKHSIRIMFLWLVIVAIAAVGPDARGFRLTTLR